jgi:virginiamycin B lyase
MRAAWLAAIAFAAGSMAGLVASSSAAARIYWANETGNSIGVANNDGTGETLNLITGATAPRGVAVGGGFIYWAHGGPSPAQGKIGRASLADPAGTASQSFITMSGTAPASATSPGGIALDGQSVYWTHVVSGPNPANQCFAPACGKIGTAALDGTGVNQLFVPAFPGSIGTTPCALAVEPDHFYWSNSGTNAIGQAHGPFAPNPNFITGASNPCGVAFATGHVYWANRGNNTIGRASIEGLDVNQTFIDTGAGNTPCGVAADANYLYWTTANGRIWRWRLDGSRGNVIESLVTDALGPCGIAVDPTAAATPTSATFSSTAVGAKSDIQAFHIANTSSSVLNVSSVTLIGANPEDFEKTGDGCSIVGIPAGGTCIVNVRFAPTATGTRTATMRVSSNATDSPADIALTGSGIPAASNQTGGGTTPGGDGGSTGAQTASNAESRTEPPPVPPLLASAASPAAGLTALRSTVAVRGGAVVLCQATNPPTASATQTLRGALPAHRSGAATSRRTVLGRGRTVVPDGQTRPVTVRLSRRARNALRARGSLSAVAEVVAVGQGGERDTVTRRVTLRASRR